MTIFGAYIPSFDHMIGPFVVQLGLLLLMARVVILYAEQSRAVRSSVLAVAMGAALGAVICLSSSLLFEGDVIDNILTLCELGYFAAAVAVGMVLGAIALFAFGRRPEPTT